MRRNLIDILACPVCKNPLELSVMQEDSEEVITGSLYCKHCKDTYPIEDSIPNLLPRDLRS